MERTLEHGQATAADSLATSTDATACYEQTASTLRNQYLLGCSLKVEGLRNVGDFSAKGRWTAYSVGSCTGIILVASLHDFNIDHDPGAGTR